MDTTNQLDQLFSGLNSKPPPRDQELPGEDYLMVSLVKYAVKYSKRPLTEPDSNVS